MAGEVPASPPALSAGSNATLIAKLTKQGLDLFL
jgi:hypothetical protein